MATTSESINHSRTQLIGILKDTTESPNIPIHQELYDKFERFKQEITTSSNPENMKDRLKRSILLWNDLLNITDNVDKKSKRYFDKIRVTLAEVFSDTNENDLFKNDSDFSRQIFFRYLDLLNTDKIHQFFTASSLLSDSIVESNVYILLYMLTALCDFVLFIDDDLPDKYDPLFKAMRLRVEQQLQTPLSQRDTSNTVSKHILTLLWNLSDRTVLVPYLLRIGFGKSIIDWLNYTTLSNDERRPLVSILHNLSRHDDGVDELNKYNAIETINKLQQLDTVRQSKMLLLSTMALALLLTPDQIKADPSKTKNILDQLLQITINASSAERYRYDDFHVSEPLAVLVKLFIDDTTFDYVINKVETNPPSNSTTIIKLFSNLLIDFRGTLSNKNRLDQFTFIALCNILWSISFHEEYHMILKQNIELINTIKNVAREDYKIIVEQYVPRLMQSVKKAADGILFNLGIEMPVTLNEQSIVQNKPLVMISYSHANTEFCDKILELLDQKSDLFDVWIDKRYCKSSADVWESIAKGIKNAQLIICIVSAEYLASKACRQEIIYAKDRLNKPFLPVYLEKPDVSDWLDIRLAEFKYVRFQNAHMKLEERKVQELLSTLMESILPQHAVGRNIPIKHNQIAPVHHEPIQTGAKLSTQPIDNTDKSVLKWTQDDIHHWFAQHDICSDIRDMYQFKTGPQMITYAECFKDGWQKQYERYAPRYAQKYQGKELPEHEFALFASSLKQLLVDSQPHIKSINQQLSNGNPLINTNHSQKTHSCVLL